MDRPPFYMVGGLPPARIMTASERVRRDVRNAWGLVAAAKTKRHNAAILMEEAENYETIAARTLELTPAELRATMRGE